MFCKNAISVSAVPTVRIAHRSGLLSTLFYHRSNRQFFGGGGSSNSSNSNSNSKDNNCGTETNKRHYERKLIHLPHDQLYDIIADVNNYKHFVPWCINSVVTNRSGDNSMRADLTVGFGMFNETYTSEITMKRPDCVTANAKNSGLFQYLKTEWKFIPANDSRSTWVSFQVDFMFKSSLYNEVSKLFLKEVTTKMVKAFEERSKQLVQQQAERKNNLRI